MNTGFSKERKYRAFFDQSLSFSALLSPEGVLEEVNKHALDATGFTAQDVVGLPLWECGWWNPSEVVATRVRNGVTEAARGGYFRDLLAFYTKSGETRLAEVSFSPIFNEQGHLLYVAAAGVDVTARDEAENSLRLAHDSFRHVVENSPFGIFTIDADFRVNLVGAGAQPVFAHIEPLIGRDLAEVLRLIWPEPFASEVIGRFRHTLETGEVYHAPNTVEERNNGGTREAYDWKIERLMLDDGRYGVVCYFYDLSEREQYEAKLREQDRRKDAFLATLAHELRNPLAAIDGALNLLRLKDELHPEAQWCFDIVERQTSHLVQMVDDLLDLNRINAGKIQLISAWASISEIAHTAIETNRPLLQQHGHELTVRLPDPVLAVYGDKVRLAQVFGNLLNNAAKYTGDGGHIEFSIEQTDAGIVADVIDNGLGMLQEDLEKIFGMFSQITSADGQSEGGLGIGLSLSKRLVELHDGQITAYSEGLGQGCRLEVVLPLDVKPLSEVDVESALAEPSVNKRRVLIADDNRDTAQSLAKVLQELGHETEVVYDGEAAVGSVADFHPDFVLLDIGMPKLDGFAACAQIRRLPGGDRMTIVAATGYGQERDRINTTAAGFDHHLVKPLNFSELNELLSQ